ncbi:hypothetical protein BABINDRAFT_162266 [Babjeviella inositovora NRRL Y-12698]|uniref:Major facilitator superfamily (MFS) profile domain-containing protein n=1 Tax=Babjeviella inositovora NRRL Y-12698 TaxID=984486 RepID=A0A1E3QNL8_9ASCO|nr:uncharacterized protein BABINDRAFT_162266 [Babjeviella inositovora NRRL Y-12698]ODQ79230.1 hypothetical protein BABINDRAFT_162266 [Babjeviella inositovora NRRL Y-12698]
MSSAASSKSQILTEAMPTAQKYTTDAEDSPSYDSESSVLPPSKKELDRIYRSLDYRIIPALWVLYFLTSFGSSAYGNTLTMNTASGHSLMQSLNLGSHDTATASALYYVGYIIFDVPMNLAMTRLQPQIWLSRIVMTVGLVYTCYAALSNAKGLIAIRFISGMCGAGTWPGLSYYISLWYPNDRTAKRIGYYFTAAQISASVAGLLGAGFQRIDMVHGLEGWKWLYLVYGSITIAVGISLVWWLPDRPAGMLSFNDDTEAGVMHKMFRLVPKSKQPLSGNDQLMHLKDMEGRYTKITWDFKDVCNILLDPRTWPLVICYFGVVGAGFGLAVFGTTIIKTNNPSLSSINVSLLYAPIWLFDLAAILLVTPFADKFKRYRYLFFSGASVIIIVGMLITTFAHGPWNKYAGLLVAGFGLGPTVPTVMAWAAEIFAPKYGDVGCAVSAALVSGLGNLGSVTATYALYSGWPADKLRLYKYSNMMLVTMVGTGILSAFFLQGMRHFLGDFKVEIREEREERDAREESVEEAI